MVADVDFLVGIVIPNNLDFPQELGRYISTRLAGFLQGKIKKGMMMKCETGRAAHLRTL
jgi:hypothetical protein